MKKNIISEKETREAWQELSQDYLEVMEEIGLNLEDWR